MPKDKKTPIRYTSREFSSIRSDLTEYVRDIIQKAIKTLTLHLLVLSCLILFHI